LTGTHRPHYDRLASTYNANWEYSKQYLDWMTGAVARHLGVAEAASLLDVGGGTGIYSSRLKDMMGTGSRVVCLDPSQAMLDQVPEGIETVCATADEAPRILASIGISAVDRVLVKEAVHHFNDPAHSLRQLVSVLAPMGRLTVAMLPPTIEYPLFRAAHDVFEADQPHFEAIADILKGLGMEVAVAHEAFELEISVDTYLEMVQDRYMSLLSRFTDQQLDDGVREMAAAAPESGIYRFADRFVFVTGRFRG
jgi:ubiquinone/menaquinone biosynthesis C-methylase UbiE